MFTYLTDLPEKQMKLPNNKYFIRELTNALEVFDIPRRNGAMFSAGLKSIIASEFSTRSLSSETSLLLS